jgi:hypothetical protein
VHVTGTVKKENSGIYAEAASAAIAGRPGENGDKKWGQSFINWGQSLIKRGQSWIAPYNYHDLSYPLSQRHGKYLLFFVDNQEKPSNTHSFE